MIERDGPASPEAQARIRRILLISRCELVVLLTVIVNMVVKPTGNAGWFWGLLAFTLWHEHNVERTPTTPSNTVLQGVSV